MNMAGRARVVKQQTRSDRCCMQLCLACDLPQTQVISPNALQNGIQDLEWLLIAVLDTSKVLLFRAAGKIPV
jgi:hypothetical protein